MIANDHELQVTLERIARFQAQVAHLRQVEAHPANYHVAASGFLAEIDRIATRGAGIFEYPPDRTGGGLVTRWPDP